jgi:hypothetical protein
MCSGCYAEHGDPDIYSYSAKTLKKSQKMHGKCLQNLEAAMEAAGNARE